ncbi:MAG: DNA repair protein RecO [Lachnospiraceae bacterium]|nr:DNA repair protein RecO [Lachnospiraceae bacterium]
MNDTIDTAGMILGAYDYSEYDKRLKILTADIGKVTVFARGVRRQNSKFMGLTDLFSFGNFRLFAGKSAYNLSNVEITNYFEDIRQDLEKTCYASYFADLADYTVHENMDGRQVLLLIYRSLQALDTKSIANSLVRAVYELKIVAENGVYPGIPKRSLLPGTVNALNHIQNADIKSLFSFKVKDDVLKEVISIADEYRKRYIQGQFRSLDVMSELGYDAMV